MNHKPAATLPFVADGRLIKTTGGGIVAKADQFQQGANAGEQTAAYLAHAASAYPILIEQAKISLASFDGLAREAKERNDDRFLGYVVSGDRIRALLTKLGEIER